MISLSQNNPTDKQGNALQPATQQFRTLLEDVTSI